jgi:hypothetical protein
MRLTPTKVNWFLLAKLPSAFFCGVRLKSLDAGQSRVSVKYGWFNQNPFRSMYFAVQMMAAELSTGILVMSKIRESGKNVSMLVLSNQAVYHKKVTGRVNFICRDGALVSDVIKNAIATNVGQTVKLKSVGTNEAGEIVSEMVFEWTVKLR